MSEEQKIIVVEDKPKHAPTLYFIVGIKIVKGVLLLLVALGVYSLAGKDLQDLFDRFLRWVHLDPEGRFFNAIGERLDTITPANVKKAALVPLIYGLFLLVGGTGLALRAKWAIWLAIGESAFFIPIEIYELVRRRTPETDMHHAMFAHPQIGLAVLLGLNILIVWYLFENRNRLFRHHH